MYHISWLVIYDRACNGLTAIGTVGAVIVALWLARKDKPKVKLSMQIKESGNVDERLKIKITNIGNVNVRVDDVYWQKGILKNKILL